MLQVNFLPPGRKGVCCQENDGQVWHGYVAEGELETDADGELDGELDTELDGELDVEADGDVDGELDGDVDETTVPTLPSKTSQRCDPAEIVTEISDRKSLASANVACVSRATFRPAGAVTTTSPPPSVFNRSVKRIPGFVGVARVLVSPEAPDTISQICKSALARMIPALPGSVRIFGPR